MDPVTAGIAVAAGGKIIQGVGGYEAGRFNAKAAGLNADAAMRDGVAQESALRDRARAAMGEQIAGQGASGFALGTGSAFDTLRESAVNAELDAMAIRRDAAMRTSGYRVQAANAKAQGHAAMVKGLFGAASAIAGGGGDYAAAGTTTDAFMALPGVSDPQVTLFGR